MTNEHIAAMEKHGLTVESDFVPFSKSRNAATDFKSLNWKVRVLKDGKAFVETDYSAGTGHCPSAKRDRFGAGAAYTGNALRRMRDQACAWEIENGFDSMWSDSFQCFNKRPGQKAHLKPNAVDVLASLIMDSDILDYGSFDDWAAALGYDSDSRKAESIYRACLELGLKMRNGLGESVLAELRETFSDW